MCSFLAAHEILLPRRENDYNEASNDVMRNSITARKPIETFHYIIKPNGDLSLVENKVRENFQLFFSMSSIINHVFAF